MGIVVVGVDGSEGAAAALRFAAREAALREARLRIVSVWEVPLLAYSSGFAPLDAETPDPFRVRARQIADEARATAKALEPDLKVQALAVEGQPANRLLKQAAYAELIVVGNRGLGGFRSLMLGSVSQQVVHHARCPVVVVHRQATASAHTGKH
jgi:nucleotide-binding universal stress UspA family protein